MALRITLQQRYLATIIGLLLTLAISLTLVYVHFFQTMMETSRRTDRQKIEQAQYQHLEESGKSWAIMLSENLVNPIYQYDLDTLHRFLKSTLNHPHVNFIEILDPKGQILHDGKQNIPLFGTVPDDPHLPQILQSKSLLTYELENQLIIATPVLLGQKPIAFIRMGLNLQPLKEKIALLNQQSIAFENSVLKNALQISLFMTLIIAIVFIFIAVVIAQNLVKPLRNLAQRVKMFGKGDTYQAINITSNDEIGDLTTAFNEMVDNLKKTSISRNHLANIIENLSDLLIVTDADKKIILVNPAVCQLLNQKEDELIGSSISLILPCELNSVLECGNNSLNAKPSQPYDCYLRTKDFHLLDVEVKISFFKDRQGHIINYIYVAQDIRNRKKQEYIRKKAEKKIHQLAYFDKLTELPNRTLFYDRLKQALNQLDRQHQKLALLYLDLDHFKSINDTKGHSVGDQLLQAVSKRLTTCLRETDTLARLGGDEFAILLCNLEKNLSVSNVAKKIICCFTKPFVIDRQHIYTDTSIGICIAPDDTSNIETLIKNADTAMYHAKRSGRGTFCFFTQKLNDKIQQQNEIQEGLHKAIKHPSEFHLLYQIQTETQSLKTHRVEALLRWQHPQRGFISPDLFIPVAEENGIITEIGYWVIEQACRDWIKWNQASQKKLVIGINISSRQLKDNDFVSHVQAILKKFNMAPQYIEFELSECMFRENMYSEPLKALNDIGINLSIDDFGTGYSSLNYLNKFNIRTLKIDKSFIGKITYDQHSKSITHSIIAMGHNMGLKVVAEGVEQEAQLNILQQSKCDFVQGYYIKSPLSSEKLVALLLGLPAQTN